MQESLNKKLTNTLLVDGNNLLKIGFHGVKEYYHKGEHIGGLFHFINTLRKFIDEKNFDKVIVFWDGHENSLERRKIYPNYKLNRKQMDNPLKELSYTQQKEKVKKYLEELFVRQVEVINNEADDLISYYCQISIDEYKIIFSGDNDLTQLISDKVSIYSPNIKGYYKNGDKIKVNESFFPHYNIKTVKILIGDSSDNIDGIYFLGDKTLLKFFPELSEKELEYTEILEKAEKILKEEKTNSSLKNLLSGKTKTGIYGEEYFQVNKKIIDLSNPLISDDAKNIVEEAYKETLDPEGRGYQNLMRMMTNDGIFKYLPKSDDAWIYFLKPFMKLTRKEKLKFKTEK